MTPNQQKEVAYQRGWDAYYEDFYENEYHHTDPLWHYWERGFWDAHDQDMEEVLG